jgi:hypothetical protein
MKARCFERSLGLSLRSLVADSGHEDKVGVEYFSQRLKGDSRSLAAWA